MYFRQHCQDDKTLVMHATRYGLKDAVEALLIAGFDVDQSDKVRQAALYLAFGLSNQVKIPSGCILLSLFLFDLSRFIDRRHGIAPCMSWEAFGDCEAAARAYE